MRRLVIVTGLLCALFAFLAGSALQTLRLGGNSLLGVSSGDLVDLGTLQRLGLQQVSVGGSVIQVESDRVVVRDRRRHAFSILFARGTSFRERGIAVSASAIELKTHLTVRALPVHGGYLASRVLITPHHHAIGGRIVDASGLLEIANHRGAISLVRVLPGAEITSGGRPAQVRLSTQMRVLALAYPDPTLAHVYLADAIHLIKTPISRWGGIVRSVDTARNLILVFSKNDNRTLTVEVKPTTRITLGPYVSGYADLHAGDHVTVIGGVDTTLPAAGPNPILARYVRVSSPTFGGQIAAVAAAPDGAVVLSVRARHGHALRIDAPGRTQVFMKTPAGQEIAHVPDLAAGEHISVHGRRTGKFELEATAIQVYPTQRTVGGTVVSILPGRYRIVAFDGTQYIVHTTAQTIYTLNGNNAAHTAVKLQLHIRVRGYDALRSDQGRIPTVIASHISVTVSVPRQPSRPKHTTTPPTPAPTPTPTSPIAPATGDNAI